jgi:5'-nucleotidase
MNLMGVQVDTFGNHNFDGGVGHLQDIIDLADYPFVAANLKNRDGNLTGVKDFEIFNVGGVKVGVIGIVNPEAPTLVFPGSFSTIVPTDPIAAALKARNAAKDAGAELIVVICHLGVTSFDAMGAPVGPLIDFAREVNKPKNTKIDLIIGDHTDVQYSGIINGALVVENRSKGATYARIKLAVDAGNKKILSQSATFVTPVASAVSPDPAIVSMLAPYRVQLAQIFDTPIAVATGIFPRGSNVERSGEVAIGNLVADALRLTYGTQLALTNAGGLRAPLPSSYAPVDHSLRRTSLGYAPGPPYDIVIGDIFAVLPFGNTVVTRTVTGAQLWAALENGVSQISVVTCDGADGRFPQISGFKFTFKCSNPAGARVLSVSLSDNTPIPADGTTYTFATNNFVNSGGDFYSVLNDGQGVTRDNMFDVTVAYVQGLGTITPTLEARITKVP